MRRECEGDAVGVTGRARAPDDAAAAEIDLVAADAKEDAKGRAPGGAYAGPCVATGCMDSVRPSNASEPPIASASSWLSRVRTRPG